MTLWVLAWLNLCLVTAQLSTVVSTVNGSSTLVTAMHGHRSLRSLLIGSSGGGFQAPMFFSLSTTNASCGSSLPINISSTQNATIDVSSFDPGTYYLCINQTQQTVASPWLTIVPGSPLFTTYYSCGNWTSLPTGGINATVFVDDYQGFAILPNERFPSNIVSCALVFICPCCEIVVSSGAGNVTLHLPVGSSVVQPDVVAYTDGLAMTSSMDHELVVWARGSGSNVTRTANYTFRLLASVSYRNLQGSVPGCGRQTQDLDITIQFGRDIPGDAGILLFFPLQTNTTTTRIRPSVAFGFNGKWDYVVQVGTTPNYFLIPLLGNSSNGVIPAGTDVYIQFPAGTFVGPSYDPLSKIIIGAYHPLLPSTVQQGSLIPVDLAVNYLDSNATYTFNKQWLTRDAVYMTPVQSVACDLTWMITFYAPQTLNNTHILVSLNAGGPMQFVGGSLPTGFANVTVPTGSELTYLSNSTFQQLVAFNGTRTECQNLTLTWVANSTRCDANLPLGGPITNVTLYLFEQGDLLGILAAGTIYVASPAPTAPPTPPTNFPTQAPSTRVLAPCPTTSPDFERMSSGQPNAPLCEVHCNISRIQLDPPLGDSCEVLCGLADPNSVSIPGIAPRDAPPPEPSGIRTTQVVNIVLVNSTGDVIPVPGKIEFMLPFLGDTTIQRAVWSTKNYKYAHLSCEYYDRETSSWSSDGCTVTSREMLFATLGGKKGGGCECNHTTEFAIIVRNVPCTAEYVEWGFGVVYSLLTFFAIIQTARVSMHPQSKPSASCDTLLIHHVLLVIVGVLRAVGMFARCNMGLEVRVLLASIPYAILLLQYLVVVLIWSSVALFAVEDSPMRYLKWVFVVGSVITIMFTLALPGIVFFDINQDERSTLAVSMSYAFGALDCAMALAGVVAGLRLACRLQANRGMIGNEGLVRKFVWLAISIGVLFVAEAALWGISVDEYSLATFEVLDAVYRGCDVLSFILLLSMFLDAVNQRSKAPTAGSSTRSSRNIKSSRGGRSIEISSKASISRDN